MLIDLLCKHCETQFSSQMEQIHCLVKLPLFCYPSLCPFRSSCSHRLLGGCWNWLYFLLLRKRSTFYENHLPLSGQQWLLQPLLCLQVEFKRHRSLRILKGQKAAETQLLEYLMKVLLCLSSFSRKYTKWPFLTGNFQEGWSTPLLVCSSYPLFLQHSTLQDAETHIFGNSGCGLVWHRLVLNRTSLQGRQPWAPYPYFPCRLRSYGCACVSCSVMSYSLWPHGL